MSVWGMTQPRRRRGWHTATSVGLAVALMVVAVAIGTPAASAAPVVDTTTWYVLVNQHSGKALDVATKGTPRDDDEKVTYTTDGAINHIGYDANGWPFIYGR